jgi:SAM-dependent methyltransferase
MDTDKPWHERDAFWEKAEPWLFANWRLSDGPEEVEHIERLLAIKPGSHILDLCCGVGRHALELARRGFRVTGVDRTQAYLDRAAEQAREEGLQAEFIRDDMREFCRPDTFDAIVNLWTSFGYFDDPQEDQRVAQNMYRSLKTGGVLFQEMLGKEVVALTFRKRDWKEDSGILVLKEVTLSRNWSWITNRWIMITDEGRSEYDVSQRLYSAAELTSLLEAYHFRDITVYGDFDGRPYDHKAKRLISIAHK